MKREEGRERKRGERERGKYTGDRKRKRDRRSLGRERHTQSDREKMEEFFMWGRGKDAQVFNFMKKEQKKRTKTK